jgi:hypothetical protein
LADVALQYEKLAEGAEAGYHVLVSNSGDGRIVLESTLSTRINAARNAIGVSGEEQRLIRTAHGKGIPLLTALAWRGQSLRSRPLRLARLGINTIAKLEQMAAAT